MDDAGNPTAEVTGIYLQRVQRRTVPLPLTQKIFDTTWVRDLDPDRPDAVGSVRWELVGVDRRRRDGGDRTTISSPDSAHRPDG